MTDLIALEKIKEDKQMVMLNAEVDRLRAAQSRVEKKILAAQNKIDAIDEKCCDADREYTRAEAARVFKYIEEINDLNDEFDEIQNAIDYLKDYCA